MAELVGNCHELATTLVMRLRCIQRSVKPPNSHPAAVRSKPWLRPVQADSGCFTRPGWLGDAGFCRPPKHYT